MSFKRLPAATAILYRLSKYAGNIKSGAVSYFVKVLTLLWDYDILNTDTFIGRNTIIFEIYSIAVLSSVPANINKT